MSSPLISHSNIGQRIKQARKKLNLTQISFAKPLGIKQSHVSSIEKGEREPSKTLILLISYHYSINRDWLLKGSGGIFDEMMDNRIQNDQLHEKFKQKRIVYDLINDLLELENLKPSELKEVASYVKFRLSKLKEV